MVSAGSTGAAPLTVPEGEKANRESLQVMVSPLLPPSATRGIKNFNTSEEMC